MLNVHALIVEVFQSKPKSLAKKHQDSANDKRQAVKTLDPTNV